MSISDDIVAARGTGTRCGVSSQQSPSVDQVAEEFGLLGEPSIEIDEAEARTLIQFVLERSLAYNTQLMPSEKAAELTNLFLSQFGSDGTQYFTNGNFLHGGWVPLTESTFDAGVIVIGHSRSGCVWVEEED